MTQMSTGGYVRHRDRMVQESVFDDIRNTLIACRWMTGTTSHDVIDPYNVPGGWAAVTTTTSEVLRLVGNKEDGSIAEVEMIEFFPDSSGNKDDAGLTRKTELNTLAVDTGVGDDPMPVELGSNMMEQRYTFALAFYAASDGVALALMNDLRDRYLGRIVTDDNLNLYNFNDPAYDEDSAPVCRMEVEAFRYSRNSDMVTPWEVNLYFAELVVLDMVDGIRVSD